MKKVEKIIEVLDAYSEGLSKKYVDNPDMKYKLHEHVRIVKDITEEACPSNLIALAAAKAHDIGRGPEYDITGGFTGKGDEDHHVLGVKLFNELMAANDIEPSNETEVISAVIRWHGLDQLKGKDGKFIPVVELAKASPKTRTLVRTITKVDDAANGMNAPYYLVREQQEHAKRVSAGGYIPDENQFTKTVSPECMEAYQEGKSFNRNAMCKSYADYNLFAAFLLNRSLKDAELGPFAARKLTEALGAIQVWDKNKNLITIEFASALDAYKATFEVSMSPEDARTASAILENAISEAQSNLPEVAQCGKAHTEEHQRIFRAGVAKLKECLSIDNVPGQN